MTRSTKQQNELAFTELVIELAKDSSSGSLLCFVEIECLCVFSLQGGFEHFDPHIPIHVQEYSDKEANSCLDYYIDNQWIQNPAGHTEAGKKEMIFLSCKNPLALYETTRAW